MIFKTKASLPALWNLGKDAGWVAVIGLVCLTTVAVSAVLRHFTGVR